LFPKAKMTEAEQAERIKAWLTQDGKIANHRGHYDTNPIANRPDHTIATTENWKDTRKFTRPYDKQFGNAYGWNWARNTALKVMRPAADDVPAIGVFDQIVEGIVDPDLRVTGGIGLVGAAVEIVDVEFGRAVETIGLAAQVADPIEFPSLGADRIGAAGAAAEFARRQGQAPLSSLVARSWQGRESGSSFAIMQRCEVRMLSLAFGSLTSGRSLR
jgi:hypothetical protein